MTRNKKWIALFVTAAALAVAAAVGYQPALELWIARGLDSDDEAERTAAATKLGAMRSRRAVPWLLELVPEGVTDGATCAAIVPNGVVAFHLMTRYSVDALEVIGRAGVGPLSRYADRVGPLRARALWMLGRQRIQAVAVFARALSSARVDERRCAAWALSRVGGDTTSVHAELLRALADVDEDVRAHVGSALSQVIEQERPTPRRGADESPVGHELRGRVYVLPDLEPMAEGELSIQIVGAGERRIISGVQIEPDGGFRLRLSSPVDAMALVATCEGYVEEMRVLRSEHDGVCHLFFKPLDQERRSFVGAKDGRSVPGWLQLYRFHPLLERVRRVAPDGGWCCDGLQPGDHSFELHRVSATAGDSLMTTPRFRGGPSLHVDERGVAQPKVVVDLGLTLRADVRSARGAVDLSGAEFWYRVAAGRWTMIRDVSPYSAWRPGLAGVPRGVFYLAGLRPDTTLEIAGVGRRFPGLSDRPADYYFDSIPVSAAEPYLKRTLDPIAPARKRVTIVNERGESASFALAVDRADGLAYGALQHATENRLREHLGSLVPGIERSEAGRFSLLVYPGLGGMNIISSRGGATLTGAQLRSLPTQGGVVNVSEVGYVVGRVVLTEPGPPAFVAIRFADNTRYRTMTLPDGSFCVPGEADAISEMEVTRVLKRRTLTKPSPEELRGIRLEAPK